MAHELKHLYQFEIGTLSFDKETGRAGYLYDATDEIEAYNRQSYYIGMVRIRNMTAADIRNLNPAYSNLKDGPLNKYSRLQKIFEGTPEGDTWLKTLSEEKRKLQFLGSGVDKLDLVR